LVREKYSFPKGYCLVNNRASFEDVIQTVENIPLELMPPSFKKAEDFVRNVMKIDYGHWSPEEADGSNFEKVCHFGQTAEEAVRDFDLHEARLTIEYGLSGGAWHLKKIKHLLDKDFYDEWIEPKYQNPNTVGREDLTSKLYMLASDVYNGRREDFMDNDIRELFTESKILGDMMDFGSESTKTKEENRAIRKEASEIRSRGNAMIEAKKQHIKDEIHNRAIENWYEKYAWDFDKEERNELKNPYK